MRRGIEFVCDKCGRKGTGDYLYDPTKFLVPGEYKTVRLPPRWTGSTSRTGECLCEECSKEVSAE